MIPQPRKIALRKTSSAATPQPVCVPPSVDGANSNNMTGDPTDLLHFNAEPGKSTLLSSPPAPVSSRTASNNRRAKLEQNPNSFFASSGLLEQRI
jgi:hypothetical protein